MQNPRKESAGGGWGCAGAEERGVLSSLRWRRAHPDPALPLLPPSIQGSTRLSHPRPGDTVNAGALLPLSFRGAPSGRGPQPSSPEGGRTKSPVPPAASSHRTPRAPALCPAAVGAALPASSAASRARARTHPRRAARRGCGSLRRSNRCGRREDACDSHACPAARPSASWRAGERAAPAAGGSAPRASRGPPAPPPASGKPRASRPYPTPPPPARASAPAPAPRLGRELGASSSGFRSRAVRAGGSPRRVGSRRSRPLSAGLLRSRGGPARPGSPAPSPFRPRALAGLDRSLSSESRAFAACTQLPTRKDGVLPRVAPNPACERGLHLGHGETRQTGVGRTLCT